MGNSGSKYSDPESWIQLPRLYGLFVFTTNAKYKHEALLSFRIFNSFKLLTIQCSSNTRVKSSALTIRTRSGSEFSNTMDPDSA